MGDYINGGAETLNLSIYAVDLYAHILIHSPASPYNAPPHPLTMLISWLPNEDGIIKKTRFLYSIIVLKG